MKQKILLISYNYYPMVNPRALRWTSIAEKMADLGYEVHMVCSKVLGEKETENINGVIVHRVGLRSQVKPGASKKNMSARNGFVKSVLKLVYNKLVKYFIWPDSNAFWIKRAAKKSKSLILAHNINKIISISHPFSGHVVGHKVWKSNRAIKWVMDIGDPFAFLEFVSINNKFLFNKLNYFYEKKIIKNSYKQSVTTPLTTEEYLRLGFDCKDSMFVIPPLLRAGYEASPQINNDVVNWVFVGTLYKKIRSPKYLLDLFVAVSNADSNNKHKLHFYGETKMCADDFLPYKDLIGQSILLHGLVRPDVAKEALFKGDLLVNIGNKTSYQLPSKLVEYIALDKKIINIKSIQKDSSEEFLSGYDQAITVDESKDVESQSEIILEKIKSKKSNKAQINLDKFGVKAVSESYLSLFD